MVGLRHLRLRFLRIVDVAGAHRQEYPEAGYAAALGSGAISTVWYPSKTEPWVEGYQAMILQAGWGMASNWVGEFAPEIERIVKRKKASGQP